MSQPIECRQIGNTTLYRGDARALLCAGVFGKIGAIISDPPYGIGYQHVGCESVSSSGHIARSSSAPIHGDSEPFDPSPWIAAAPLMQARGCDRERRIVLWGADHFRARLPESGTLLAWDKHLGVGADDGFADCEWAWCGRRVKREVFRYLWKGLARNKTNPLDTHRRLHVSQKPVELMRWCIEKARPFSGLPILDPYMGSGSTLVAAYTMGLPAIGCEINPEIFDIACKRLEAMSTSAALAVA